MRRYWVVALALLTLLGVLSPPAMAQAPAPKVTINGLIDMLTSTSHNLQDANFTRVGDSEWYSRTRGRFDVTGQVGKAKGVLGLEIDALFGEDGADAQRRATTGSFDLNTDVVPLIEVKWLYTEFPVPLVPVATTIRLGAQPFATTYKLGTLASGDFAGVYLASTWTPQVKSHFTYVQIEEEVTGGTTGGGVANFNRGDDFAAIFDIEVTPIKGLDIRPIYALAWFQGATHGNARQIPGTIAGPLGFNNKPVNIGACAAPFPCYVRTHEEWRHTIGVDARWRWGALYVNPTFFYQFGDRDTDNPFPTGTTNLITNADISAWLFDIAGGYRWGAFLLEGRYMYTSGNRPKDQLWRDVNYYQPINTDTTYWADNNWGNIYSLGIDYFNGAILGMGANISLNRYGRQQFGVKGSYNWTPALATYLVVSPAWTARSVDTDANPFGAVNCATHSANSAAQPAGAGCDGDESYIGTEGNIGVTWRFAPGLAFDLVGAILFAGDALDRSEVRNGVLTKRDAEDVYAGVARVRYTF